MTTSREGTRARPGGVRPAVLAAGAAGAAVVLLGGAALVLGDDDAPAPSSAVAPQASAAPEPTAPPSAAPEPTATSAAADLSPAVVAATAASRTPADARVALEEQLAARAMANLALLRGAWTGDEAASARAAQAVAASSAGLAAVVTAWQDADLANRLRTGLDEQSDASRAYATAVAAGDTTSADRARAQMAEVSRQLGTDLDAVTEGRIATYVPPQDAAKYRAFVDALEAGDTAAAAEAGTWLQARLRREGAALALGLSGGRS